VVAIESLRPKGNQRAEGMIAYQAVNDGRALFLEMGWQIHADAGR
jgi:hypothetical protein